MGVESDCKGIIDIVNRKAYQFVGSHGNVVEEMAVPDNMSEEVSVTALSSPCGFSEVCVELCHDSTAMTMALDVVFLPRVR